jgi:hypothetical protein
MEFGDQATASLGCERRDGCPDFRLVVHRGCRKLDEESFGGCSEVTQECRVSDRLATKPCPTGPLTTLNTIGIVLVACFSAAGPVPNAPAPSRRLGSGPSQKCRKLAPRGNKNAEQYRTKEQQHLRWPIIAVYFDVIEAYHPCTRSSRQGAVPWF